MQKKLERFITEVPKAEVHLHLEGCIQLDTLWQLYQKNEVDIEGVSNKEDLAKLYQMENLDQFVHFFINVLQRCVCKAEDIPYYFIDLQNYMDRNNVRYAELFFSPTKLVQEGVSYSDIADRLQQGTEQLAAAGYTCQFLIDVSRSFGPENAMANLNNVLANPRKAIIGIGLGGSEQRGPAKDYREVFAKARENQLRCVAHAGEDAGPESIRDSIDILGVERIGHGTSAVKDPELRAEIKRRKIPLEISITSNTFTRSFVTEASQHPVRLFQDEGLLLTLNSDDPALFHSELRDEYQILIRDCGFKAAEVLQIMENNVMTSFMPEQDKQSFIDTIQDSARKHKII
ncbi:adenosine deaminase [Candidatus Haliotispira prima]|uniref:Adenosine deaminase n=1 Tax=Candidatus Haliotispira prima TaxID=3034016 RepID=A0ABY8MF82_9SPIO|nr:adenosine deaminase [Candidatus Haliotispira prima]